jgi:hypothetical protein
VHGDEDPSRPLNASHGVSILPWDAAFYFAVLLQRLGHDIPEGAIDPVLLDDVHRQVMSMSNDMGPLSHILAMLARSNILTVQGGTWRFVHRWKYAPEINDYVRR